MNFPIVVRGWCRGRRSRRFRTWSVRRCSSSCLNLLIEKLQYLLLLGEQHFSTRAEYWLRGTRRFGDRHPWTGVQSGTTPLPQRWPQDEMSGYHRHRLLEQQRGECWGRENPEVSCARGQRYTNRQVQGGQGAGWVSAGEWLRRGSF